MNFLQLNPLNTLAAAVFFFSVFFTACADNSVGNGDNHDDHTDPVGLELVHDGDVILDFLDGEVTEYSHMHLEAGEEYQFSIHFLDADGDRIDDFDESYYLDWIVGNEDVLTMEQYDDDDAWSFHLIALDEGESTLQIQLMHGSSGSAHADFSTPSVTDDNAIEFHVGESGHQD
ncbi:MAG: hypothetical protein WD317_11930 [Balneolaceae bacterium]